MTTYTCASGAFDPPGTARNGCPYVTRALTNRENWNLSPAPTLAKTVVPFEGFKMQIRNPSNDMPAYSEPVMSDREIADIYAFMQSLPGRGNPKDIAILND